MLLVVKRVGEAIWLCVGEHIPTAPPLMADVA